MLLDKRSYGSDSQDEGVEEKSKNPTAQSGKDRLAEEQRKDPNLSQIFDEVEEERVDSTPGYFLRDGILMKRSRPRNALSSDT